MLQPFIFTEGKTIRRQRKRALVGGGSISLLLSREQFSAAVEFGHDPARAVVVLNLDFFKEVNDLFGHAIGNRVICQIADLFIGELQGNANLALGYGAEFLFVTAMEDAARVGEHLVDLVAGPRTIDGNLVSVTASVGVAPYLRGEPVETALYNAGLALRKAKANGGNQLCMFSQEMRCAVERRKLLTTELRQALARDQFTVVYQPQYQIEDRRLVGFEALLRWNHPEFGFISPGEFIPLAEERGLIIPIGAWVLQTACEKAASWPDHVSISINVSPRQFQSQHLIVTVAKTLENTGILPARLELEVTEGTVLMNSFSIEETFHTLRALGVRFAMDDFGTGYSSLSYLQKFPFDKIKIDQSFVRKLAVNRDSRAIVRAICALGKSLGLTTMAEGVETDKQLEQLRKMGCRQVQGYLLGHPLSPDVADDLVGASE